MRRQGNDDSSLILNRVYRLSAITMSPQRIERIAVLMVSLRGKVVRQDEGEIGCALHFQGVFASARGANEVLFRSVFMEPSPFPRPRRQEA